MREDIHSSAPPISKEGPTDEARRAVWYPPGVFYSDSTWPLGFKANGITPVVLDFDYPLGRHQNLLQCTSLYRSAKEFAWWSRESGWSNLEGADTLRIIVHRLFHILSSLALKEIYDLSEVKPQHLTSVLKDAVGGVDKLIRASERIDEKFTSFADGSDVPAEWLLSGGGLDRVAVIRDLNLPDFAEYRPAVSAIFNQHCKRLGIPFSYTGRGATGPIGRSVYDSYERVCDALFAMRHHMDAESINFDPEISRQGALSKRRNVVGKRTPIPPPRLVFHLMARSARLVLEDGKSMLAAYRAFVATPPQGRRAHNRAGSLHNRLRAIFAACFFILAAFLARRPVEVLLLCSGCLLLDRHGDWWIKVRIVKGKRRKEIYMPAPELVVETIRLLEAIQEPVSSNGRKELFYYLDLRTRKAKRGDPTKGINRFARDMQTPQYRTKDGKLKTWHWQPRQGRRFTAIMYFYKYDVSTEAVATLLGQTNLRAARIYTADDPTVAALWHEEEWSYIEKIVRDIVTGTETYGGAGALRIERKAKKLAELLAAHLKVVTVDTIVEGIVELERRSGTQARPSPCGICLCPMTKFGAERSLCQGETSVGVGPDPRNAAHDVCGACPWCVTTEATRNESQAAFAEWSVMPEVLKGSILEELWTEKVGNFRALLPLLEPRAGQGVRF